MRKEAALTALALWVACGLLTGCGGRDQAVTLSCKFPPDRTATYRHEAVRNVRVFRGDRLSRSYADTTMMTIEESVTDTADDFGARLQCVYTWDEHTPIIDDSTGTPTGKYRTDRHQAVWNYVQEKNGKITEFGTTDELPPEQYDFQKRLFEQMDPMYPGYPVRLGDSWSNTVKILLGVDEKTDATTTYTVKAFERRAGYDCVVIDYEGMLIVPRATIAPDGTRHTISVETIKRSGTFCFAYREGFIVRQTERFDLIAEGTEYAEGKTEPVTRLIDGSYTTRLIDIERQ
ncbi:MAG: hypothetical protein JW763_09165 [candidate division Zixibacteria bacterium]|nr:hypothetical protein [candidate division Zixibacteria bacterium]